MIKLEELIQNEIDELINHGRIKTVDDINQKIRDKLLNEDDFEKFKLNSETLPMYFSGELKSKIVFVELNLGAGLKKPVVDKNSLITNGGERIFDFESYKEYFQYFGNIKIRDLLREGKKIPVFDRKQMDFFTGFGHLDVDSSNEYTWDDMRKTRVNKLQLEIIPYSSRRFDFNLFKNIEEHIDRVFNIIKQHKRNYIFLTGNKKQIEKIVGKVKFKNYHLNGRKNKDISLGFVEFKKMLICLIPSYKSQSLYSKQMIEYGQFCKDEYDKYLD